MTSSVDLGFLEEKDTRYLHPRFFPSKVGGKPAWLDLEKLPSPADNSCKLCNEPLSFLCQIYAPYEELDYCFHRSLFVFICPNGSCCKSNSSENFRVFRCQLPRVNKFYSDEPHEEKENEDFTMENWSKLCYVCGNKGPSHCSKCKKISYCSRKHQVLDWQKEHKESCPKLQTADKEHFSNFLVTASGKSVLFKEWEVVIDAEDETEILDTDVNQEMEKLKKMIAEKKAGSLSNASESELEQYTNSVPQDKIFNKFSKRVARHPDQVLRYDRGGSPLWITGNTDNSVVHIPNCPYCGGERQFEFQVMPQLLNYIDVGIELNSIDWGVLLVYTCKASCHGDPVYKQEFMIKQDLAS